MSIFYRSLPKEVALDFKKRKKQFKKGKPCAICGKIFPPDRMMVAHKTPVTDLSDHDALYDTTNWEVRCVPCEQAENRRKDREKSLLLDKNNYNQK